MASLGSFGVQRDAPEESTFDYFGETVRVNPSFGELDLVDFLDVAAGIDTEENMSAAMALLKGTMRSLVQEDDFDTFWATAKRERQGIEDLMSILYAVVEAATERPTNRPSDSSDGPQPTSVTSADDSSSRVIRRLEQEGRPSIALMVARQAEASAATG